MAATPARLAAAFVLWQTAAGVAFAASPEPPPGAAACSGCHPASNALKTSVPPLAGRSPAEIIAAMQEFRSGKRSATVMDRIAKGFSDGEVQAIAEWLGAQR